MRDVFVSLFIIGSLPTCFRRPFIGLLMFSLLAYMRLQDLTWGFARNQRWSYYVALVTMAGFFFTGGEKRFMANDLRCWAMVLLTVFIALSFLFSGQIEPRDPERFVDFCKIIGVALFTTGVVRNREYLRILVWVVALSFGFYGVKNGLNVIQTGGSLVIIQGPGGMLADNNDFALALCMGIPMLLHLGWSERRPILRRTVIAMVPLTAITIAATHSRGAFLAMSCTLFALVWRSRNRVAGFVTLLLIAIAGYLAAPASYKERIASIAHYETEGSAKGRLDAWKVALQMIKSNPMLGVGFDKFQRNYKHYDPAAQVDEEGGTGTRVAHNSYLQIWAECGTPAFLCYLFLIALTFWDVWRIRRQARQRYHSSWILSYATMFEASLVAFVVGSFFLNRAHFDLFYHFVAIVAVFGLIARAAMSDEVQYPLRGGPRGPLAWVRPRGFGPAVARGGFATAAAPSGFATAAGRSGFNRPSAPSAFSRKRVLGT